MKAFLTEAGWQDAARTPLSGDASSRRYTRLTREGETAIVMQDPQPSGTARFAEIAGHLRQAGLNTPRILAHSPEAGLMLIEDFGDALFAARADTPAREGQLYALATDVLITLHHHAPPAELAVATPDALAQATGLAFTDYTDAPALGDTVADVFQPILARQAAPAGAWVLRDYHAENLLYLPDRKGVERAGLLDFQDALIGHPAYDLASLIFDARRDLFPGTAEAVTARFAAQTGAPRAALDTAIAVLSVHRNLRILGVFARLARCRGKPGYLAYLPRVWRHIQTGLSHPALAPLRAPLARLPEPSPDHLSTLGAACSTP